jgi:hypothetical protein
MGFPLSALQRESPLDMDKPHLVALNAREFPLNLKLIISGSMLNEGLSADTTLHP